MVTDTIAMCRVETATSVRSQPRLSLFYVPATADDTEFVVFAVSAATARLVIQDRRRHKAKIRVPLTPIRMHPLEGDDA